MTRRGARARRRRQGRARTWARQERARRAACAESSRLHFASSKAFADVAAACQRTLDALEGPQRGVIAEALRASIEDRLRRYLYRALPNSIYEAAAGIAMAAQS